MSCRVCFSGVGELQDYTTAELNYLQENCQRCLSVEDNREIERIIKGRGDDSK